MHTRSGKCDTLFHGYIELWGEKGERGGKGGRRGEGRGEERRGEERRGEGILLKLFLPIYLPCTPIKA